MKIFLIEDDTALAKVVKDAIQKYGFEVEQAQDFAKLTEEFQRVQPDLVLMDINLPYFDGFYWTRQLRLLSNLPIIFLSARDHPMDQVMAMEYGGDDYLVKPFDNEVLVAKIKSQLRRAYGEYSVAGERIFSFHELQYFPERLEVHFGDQKEYLTKKEGELLELLIEHAPRIVKRETFLMKLWDDERFVDDNTLSVNMGRLRKKLEDMGLVDKIQTLRGQGYQLVWKVEK
ncbi:response regulator transcription factor [Enterococcus asini]|uniref:response regulator transcription factor n=1 Tax=Enterococcus asini TaxID=57732 RepID=UPI00288F23BA|nr:response regulator transcription factor [Enterococcus asini]MDT2763417.1 response regulator transcription factor [Enterococcus asini]